ncbi:COX15/CtaA family protein [Dokdonia sp. Hel_I_53]|uniref:COX15/CtaA family protein n=1 Tax=Dokdonia sp. Hel_I_53 TaxID=1566287 RepID=UPI00119B4AC7|nr:COX15/CtaA family protein [Dokdonia sp. Hel_I_53]TVZ51789.1 cytochrome c oxidase assembly protein subunit 15 [Dokdonia sp. Hel_I_53]
MWYRKALKTSIIFLYLIIIAGAVVRMTGSGMGCPDWPQCFGYLIPPTEESEIQWKPNHAYEEGQVIIRQESLRIAPSDFTTKDEFNEGNWEIYEKHDYAVFNVWHTWIEYINRVVTAIAGIPMLLMVVLAFSYWNRKSLYIFGSFLVLPLMLFQAWLGKQVVDSNLLPVKITIHMIAALFIVALLLWLWHASQQRENLLTQKKYNSLFSSLILVASLLTLVQIALGTQVRQYVDERVAEVGYDAKSLWLDPATSWFYIHRSFSILVTVLNIYLFWQNRSVRLGHTKLMNWTLVLISLEVITGIAMYYFDFPFGTQPLHLVLASLLFGVQFYILLESFKKREVSIKATL